jgi:tripartite-type tricarboxylate transporter receptor subunit TctC
MISSRKPESNRVSTTTEAKMPRRTFSIHVSLALITSLFIGSTSAFAEEFYAGKTIRFVVGSAAGGGYDTYTRMIARHIGRYIPGNPAAVVENMEGAGGLIAANYLYKRAAPDGLTITVFNNARKSLSFLVRTKES